jgi:hypothetical protein
VVVVPRYQGMEFLCHAGVGPFAHPAPDCPIGTTKRGDPFVARSGTRRR